MKKNLLIIVLSIICPILLISCEDSSETIIGSTNNNYFEVSDFWDESSFKPLNDEFNDFRELQAGLLFPYNLENSQVRNYFKNPDYIESDEIWSIENPGNGYMWIEVTYPKNDPSKVEFHAYNNFCTYESMYFYGLKVISNEISDTTVLRSDDIYKDGKVIASIDQLPRGKYVINMNNKRQLLYDFQRIALASDSIMYYNDSTDMQTAYSLQDVKDKIINSGERMNKNYFATDPYGGRILGTFGSLISFFLPINGPSKDGMVHEVITVREGEYLHVSNWNIFYIIMNGHFLYKNAQSPAAQYLPESVWDIKDFSLWKIKR